MRTVLEVFDVPEPQERIYRQLLARPRSPVAELARLTGLTPGAVRDALLALERLGLVGRVATQQRAYIATPVNVAVETLIIREEEKLLHQQATLKRARGAAARLLDELRTEALAHPSDLLEILSGADTVHHRFQQLQRGAVTECRIFDAPPHPAEPTFNEGEVTALARGVRYRAIYATADLDWEGHFELIEQYIAAGEEARVFPTLPSKLVIADDVTALVPLHVNRPGADGSVLVHSPALVQSLGTLFELQWAIATPIGAAPADPGGSPGDRRLLTLLTAGLSDAAIARQLGCSRVTVNRQVTRLMQQLGVVSRFQAGAEAVRRGLI